MENSPKVILILAALLKNKNRQLYICYFINMLLSKEK